MSSDVGLYALDICAGSGIGSAVWRALGGRTVCYMEKDAYCQRLLQARMRDGVIDDAPIWDDLTTFDGRPWRGLVDLMFGGIPCQPWSVAGKQQGEADERDLWPAFRRVLREVRPRFALCENVPGLLAHSRDGMGRILRELAQDGYVCEWAVLAAQDVGAPHRRERVWVVADAAGDLRWPVTGCLGGREVASRPEEEGRSICEGMRKSRDAGLAEGGAPLADAQGQPLRPGLCQGGQGGQRRRRLGDGGGEGDVPDACDPRPSCSGRGDEYQGAVGFLGDGDGEVQDALGYGHRAEVLGEEVGGQDTAGPAGWAGGSSGRTVEPRLGRVAHGLVSGMEQPGPSAWADGWEDGVPRVASGVPDRVNRLRVIGNGWVPQVAVIPLARIAELLAGGGGRR